MTDIQSTVLKYKYYRVDTGTHVCYSSNSANEELNNRVGRVTQTGKDNKIQNYSSMRRFFSKLRGNSGSDTVKKTTRNADSNSSLDQNSTGSSGVGMGDSSNESLNSSSENVLTVDYVSTPNLTDRINLPDSSVQNKTPSSPSPNETSKESNKFELKTESSDTLATPENNSDEQITDKSGGKLEYGQDKVSMVKQISEALEEPILSNPDSSSSSESISELENGSVKTSTNKLSSSLTISRTSKLNTEESNLSTKVEPEISATNTPNDVTNPTITHPIPDANAKPTIITTGPDTHVKPKSSSPPSSSSIAKDIEAENPSDINTRNPISSSQISSSKLNTLKKPIKSSEKKSDKSSLSIDENNKDQTDFSNQNVPVENEPMGESIRTEEEKEVYAIN